MPQPYRFTVDHRIDQRDRNAPHLKSSRPSNYFKVGGRLGKMMATHLGCDEGRGCSIVSYTIFQVMGRDAHADNGVALRNSSWDFKSGCGRWVHTVTRSYGFVPVIGNWRRTGRSEWIRADNFRAANEILGAFGLTMEQVLDAYGPVADGERRIMDLPSIVLRFRPDLCPSLA